MGSTEGLLDEHFVPVAGYPWYEVSNYGRIVNTRTGREITSRINRNGNLYVRLFDSGAHTIPLRRLVAEAFFADYKPWMDVYLISANREDCSVRNITLTKPDREKIEEALAPARRPIRVKENGEVFTSALSAAKRIGGDASVILKCLYGMGKTHKGYTFEWVKED